MIAPGLGGDLDDRGFGQAEVIDPAANVRPCWPALPPGRERLVGIDAQRLQQLCEEPIKLGIARLRVLLLLYWFT